MANIKKSKGTIAILTGGGDVPGLNPAIRAVTFRALREGYEVIGLRRGWAGITQYLRDPKADNSNNVIHLTEEIVNKAGRTGGTFLHTSRTRPSHMKKAEVPEHLKDTYNQDVNDLTPESFAAEAPEIRRVVADHGLALAGAVLAHAAGCRIEGQRRPAERSVPRSLCGIDPHLPCRKRQPGRPATATVKGVRWSAGHPAP